MRELEWAAAGDWRPQTTAGAPAVDGPTARTMEELRGADVRLVVGADLVYTREIGENLLRALAKVSEVAPGAALLFQQMFTPNSKHTNNPTQKAQSQHP